jgi:localization factor PodJL
MARATPQTAPQDPADPDPSDWRNLRNELMQLLDQVETQVSRGDRAEAPAELPQTVEAAANDGEDARHREALKSVQRAVDRFSDRDDSVLPPNPRDSLEDAIQQIRASQKRPATPTAAAPVVPPPPSEAEPPRLDAMAGAVGLLSRRLEDLEVEISAQSRGQTANVKEIADQLAQLSHVVELLAGAVGEAGQVKRLEGQLANLARLVSETPEVDLSGIDGRMEDVARTIGTLAELQKSVVARDDREELSQRLEDVTRTVERLADLQQGHAERVERIGIKDRLEDVSATVGRLADLQVQVANRLEHPRDGIKDGLGKIEESLRSVYDRIDSVEQSVAMAPAELEKVTDELGKIAVALQDPKPPKALVEMIDVLSERVARVEGRNEQIGALKSDLQSLRGAVAETLEPRFTALEQQLETLSDRMSRKLTPDPGIAQIESQVRQLVARMDQTGEQLSGLARLYSEPAETAAPDYEAIAEAVAARTSDMLAKLEPQQVAAIDDDGFAEIERRFERVLKAASEEKSPSEDFVALRSTIDEVGSRLARLEASLSIRAAEAAAEPAPASVSFDVDDVDPPAPPPAAPVAAMTAAAADAGEAGAATPAAPAAEANEDPLAAVMAAISAQAAVQLEANRDAMPANPAAKAPLKDRPFPDPVAPDERRHHPGLEQEIADLARAGRAAQRGFDTDSIERPPQPQSSLDARDAEATPAAGASDGRAATPARDVSTSSRNTFIEAHRRASRQATSASAEPAPGGNSLIGRAFARFQAAAVKSEPIGLDTPGVAAEPLRAPDPVVKATEGDKRAKPSKSAKAGKATRADKAKAALLPGDAPTTEATKPGGIGPVRAPTRGRVKVGKTGAAKSPTTPGADEAEAGESFLLRHRKPILLAAAIVALGCLTINFLSQRLAETPAHPAGTPVSTGDAALDPIPLARQTVDLAATSAPDSRATAPMLDATATSAIESASPAPQALVQTEPQLANNFVAEDTSDGPPTAVTQVAEATPADGLSGPIKVEMPPDGIGPDPLRQAASNGDERAQFEVAAIYTEGRAVPQDLKAAAKWYERAAAQGFAPAQYRLGSLYEHGEGVAKDLSQARLWYERAAEAGNRMAMHNLAALYAGGNLGKQQFDTAAKWFEEAADRGLTDSQFNLGMLYARGLGVPQSLADSYKWFALAATKGDADAAKARDDVAASLDAATVQKLNDAVKAWTPDPVNLIANYAPIGTWAKDFDPGATVTTPDVVLEVQKTLQQLGYDVGSPDGIAGPMTAQAIRTFERGTGMTESGAVNPRLLAVLGSQPA